MKPIKTIIGASAICIITANLHAYTDPLGNTFNTGPDQTFTCPQGTFFVCVYFINNDCFSWGCSPCPEDCNNGYYNKCTAKNGYICTQWACTKCEQKTGFTIKTKECAVQKSDCYIPAGNAGTDSMGTYTYTTDCYYSE